MTKRFCKGAYTDEYKKTIGVDFLEKTHYVPGMGDDVRFLVWDTAGQEEFDTITRTYYRGAGACVLVFSTTDRASFEAVPKWVSKVQAEVGNIAMCLVQNKVDLIDDAVVTPDEAEDLARKLGTKFFRTSVKDNLNVTPVFEHLAELHDRMANSGMIERAEAAQPMPSRPPASAAFGAVGGGGASAAASASAPAAPASTRAAGPGSAPGAGGAKAPAAEGGTSFKIDARPTKSRTGGKKKLMSSVKCSII